MVFGTWYDKVFFFYCQKIGLTIQQKGEVNYKGRVSRCCLNQQNKSTLKDKNSNFYLLTNKQRETAPLNLVTLNKNIHVCVKNHIWPRLQVVNKIPEQKTS